jgi:uncharacterized protein (TIGR03083 family)
MDEQVSPGLDALRHSCARLQALVSPLSAEDLRKQSYDTEWSVAQVLSHLGAQGEIFRLCIIAGLNGEEPPGREQFVPVWDEWNAKEPEQQAAGALEIDQETLRQFESLLKGHGDLQIQAFGMQLTPEEIVRLRVSEHAVHTWDIKVAFDASATVSNDAVVLILDHIGRLIAHRGKPIAAARTLLIETTEPNRRYKLEIGESLSLSESSDDGKPDLRIPAEVLVRLAYGRLDPAHTPPIEFHDVDIGELRLMFPGL